MSKEYLAPQYASFCSYAIRRCGNWSAFVRRSMLRRHVALVVGQIWPSKNRKSRRRKKKNKMVSPFPSGISPIVSKLDVKPVPASEGSPWHSPPPAAVVAGKPPVQPCLSLLRHSVSFLLRLGILVGIGLLITRHTWTTSPCHPFFGAYRGPGDCRHHRLAVVGHWSHRRAVRIVVVAGEGF